MVKPPDPDLSLIQPDVSPPGDEAEALYVAELKTYASADDEDDKAYERRARRAFLSRELKQIDEIIESRKNYANKIYCLVVWWLIAVALLILLVGFKRTGFELDVKVILALVGGTTLNVLGIFTIVANFLFPKNGHAILSRVRGAREDSGKVAAAARPRVRAKPRAPGADAGDANSRPAN